MLFDDNDDDGYDGCLDCDVQNGTRYEQGKTLVDLFIILYCYSSLLFYWFSLFLKNIPNLI